MGIYACHRPWASVESIAFAAKHGLGLNVDLWLPQYLDERPTAEIAAALRERIPPGMPLSVHGAFLDLSFTSKDRRIQEVSRLRVEQSLQIAEALGAPCAVFHTGYSEGLLKWTQWSAGEYAGLVCEFWQRMSIPEGVEIVLENAEEEMPELLREMAVALRQSGIPVSVCFDVAHAHIFSPHPVSRWVSELAEHLRWCHLSDNDGQVDSHLALGTGGVDFTGFFAALKQRELAPGLILELDDVGALSESLCFLRDVGAWREWAGWGDGEC